MVLVGKLINSQNRITLKFLIDLFLKAALLLTLIAVFIPFIPHMPGEGLDPSWKFGMNQAVEKGLKFGKELIFTFGPYASIHTMVYHPSTDFMMIAGSLYLAISYWVGFLFIMKGVQWRWTIIFCLFLAGVMHHGIAVPRNVLFLSFSLLAGLVSFKLSTINDETRDTKKCLLTTLIMFSSLGLLPLIKGTMLFLCAVTVILCFLFLVINNRRNFAIICVASPVISMLLFWQLSGQSITDLPNYFSSMLPITAGYTEAMSSNGGNKEILLYLLCAIFVLLSICMHNNMLKFSKIFIFLIFSIFLFISFKLGFVRHDIHAVIAGISILLSAILLPFIFYSKILFPVIVFSFISWNYICSHYIPTSALDIYGNIVSTYASAWNGLMARSFGDNWLRHDFDMTVLDLKDKASIPILKGSVDIYSYNQSYLISSGNIWSPRPIFQSYSAYTTTLVEINREHLIGDNAPDNIIFRVEPIDGRIPSSEDGASWPILLTKYSPTMMKNNFLFLQKREQPIVLVDTMIRDHKLYSFGERVELPQGGQLVFTKIDIHPTLLGRLVSFFYKPTQLQITLELNDGTKKKYRIIRGMIKSGFLLSPLIENNEEFRLLYANSYALEKKTLKSFKIDSVNGKSIMWKDKYTVTINNANLSY